MIVDDHGTPREHFGPVIVHDLEGKQRLMDQANASKLGWDGFSPVMYLRADGSVECVVPGRH